MRRSQTEMTSTPEAANEIEKEETATQCTQRLTPVIAMKMRTTNDHTWSNEMPPTMENR